MEEKKTSKIGGFIKGAVRKVKNHVREHWFEDTLLLVAAGASAYTAVNCIKDGDTVTFSGINENDSGHLEAPDEDDLGDDETDD